MEEDFSSSNVGLAEAGEVIQLLICGFNEMQSQHHWFKALHRKETVDIIPPNADLVNNIS